MAEKYTKTANALLEHLPEGELELLWKPGAVAFVQEHVKWKLATVLLIHDHLTAFNQLAIGPYLVQAFDAGSKAAVLHKPTRDIVWRGALPFATHFKTLTWPERFPELAIEAV